MQKPPIEELRLYQLVGPSDMLNFGGEYAKNHLMGLRPRMVLALLGFSSPVWSQQITAAITGTVEDSPERR